jgi:hypothetical protein
MLLGHLIAHAFSRTKAGQFFNALALVLMVAALPIASVAGFSAFAWHEIAKESDYHRRFGVAWKAPYEAEQGSLTAARTKAGVALLAVAVNSCLGVWLYRQLLLPLFGAGYTSGSRKRRPWSRRRTRRRSSQTLVN